MKKNSIFSKVTAIVLTLAFVIIPFPVNAISIEEEVEMSTIDVVEVINLYKSEPNITYTIADSKGMRSFAGENAYTLYELNPYGYAIILNETGTIMEACYTESSISPINVNSSNEYYYGGPGIYGVKSGNDIINLYTNEVFDGETISSITAIEATVHTEEQSRAAAISSYVNSDVLTYSTGTTPVTYSVEYDYFSELTKYGTNTLGTCKELSAAILLGYFDEFIDDNIVADIYRWGNGTNEDFHQHIVEKVDDCQGVLEDGVNLYFSEMEMEYELINVYDYMLEYVSRFPVENFTTDIFYNMIREYLIDLIVAGDPIIVGMHENYGAYYNHAAIAYSVTYIPATKVGSAMFTCNMGWGADIYDEYYATEYYISSSWFFTGWYIA